MAVWHKLKTEPQSSRKQPILTDSSLDSGHPETGYGSRTKAARTVSSDRYPNHTGGAQASNDGERELRIAALRQARSSHELRTAGQTAAPATAGSPSSPSSRQGETARPPRVAIAAALLQNLEPDQLAALSAYEQAVITELGQYALEAAAAQPTRGDAVSETAPDPRAIEATDAPAPADLTEKPVDAAALADSYLRVTLGHVRYNQLSILAAVRAYEARRAAVGSGNR